MESDKEISSKLGDNKGCTDVNATSAKPQVPSQTSETVTAEVSEETNKTVTAEVSEETNETVTAAMSEETNEKQETFKRKADEDINDKPPKEPKLVIPGNVPKERIKKNALSTLHEMFRKLNVRISSQEGPTNAPVFTAEIVINGITFSGQGKNKKRAKHAAAEAALKSLVQLKSPDKEPASFTKSESTDFTGDSVYNEINNFDEAEAKESSPSTSVTNGENGDGSCNNHSEEPQEEKKGEDSKKNRRKSDPKNRSDIYAKNPVMLLNEMYPSVKYELVSESKNQATKYTMAVFIDGQRFEGQGSSKKLSKAAAARCALSIYYNVVVPDNPVPVDIFTPPTTSSLPQKFADHVAQLINDQFDSLIPKYSMLYRRKVLAGFVLSEDYELPSCKVITLSTGTKCINGEKMSVNGTVLNDSHAEILSRRALCYFFYRELEKFTGEKPPTDSIFEAKEEGGFRLKPNYKFHLFINTAPCGDSRIFSPYDITVEDKHPNRKARGQLRTKIECGEGTIPVKSSKGIQTWDGVLLGERLLTMSCSDKIAKWNVVGLQGALLSNFIEPIYLDSIILGSLFHPSHLYRAVCGRVEKTITGIAPPYRLNHPKLSGTVNTEKRQTGKTPTLSVNWCLGETVIEVINAVTGRTDQNTISRISKCKLFHKFLKLLEKIPTTTGLTKREGPLLYSFCKESASEFQAAKKTLFKAMVKAELGEWIKKPMEVDQFEWDINSLDQLFSVDFNKAVMSSVVCYELEQEKKTE